MNKFSYPKSKIKILLLENIHINALQKFERDGFTVEHLTKTLPEEKLIEKIVSENIRVIGIRSRTKLTEKLLKSVPRLLAIGCFCIGTNQVDLDIAQELGIPVFNSPFCNSRSVAELIIGQIITLSRHLGDSNMQMHNGIWYKYAKGRREIRGKTLGIIGYGNIGSQVSVLAENMGIRVIFYDIISKLALGNAQRMDNMNDVLENADFVSLHVPETSDTKGLIAQKQLLLMKKGSYLLNASRGTVVVLEDLAESIKNGHLAGAYCDVFPTEPKLKHNDQYINVLQKLPNVLLTPHIGGATEEAQSTIGTEVADKLIRYINDGSSIGTVNFPNACQAVSENTHRILNIHRNIPKVLKNINEILSEYNITRQTLNTTQKIGYLIVDVDKKVGQEIKQKISKLKSSIKTRILY